MSEHQFISIAGGLIAAMFGLLAAILGWGGARMITSIDAMRDKLNEVSGELHSRINGIDNRVIAVETKLETHCSTHPGFMVSNHGQ